MAKQWYQQNLRFLQTVLREIDIVHYDAQAVVAYMKKTHTNTLVVNAGGIIDFFDNPLEMGNVNRFKTAEHMLEDICRESHAAGIHVIVRVDFRGVDQERYDQHPDWFSAGPDGEPKRAQRGLISPCYTSYYANEHAVEYIDYLMEHFDIDGIWENALGFHQGPCYCKRCRDLYRAETGKEIPVLDDSFDKNITASFWSESAGYASPLFDEYRRWKAKKADEHIARLRDAVKKHGEEKAYCAEIFDLYNCTFALNTGIDHANAKRHFDFLISCVFLNSIHSQKQTRVYDIIHNAGTTIRFSRSLQPKKQPVICTGGNGTRWRYIADPALETRLWMWEIASVGGGIWNCYFNGQCPALTHDRRGAYSEQDVYTYLAENSGLISDSVPMRDVALYYSKYTRDRFCDMDESVDQYGVGIKGIERVLTENHIQYGFVPDTDFTEEKLRGLKALLIPNGALMSDHDIELVRSYVKEGGGLIASYNTSLYDENGRLRQNFGLSDLFGVDYTGMNKDTRNDCYQLIADKDSPILSGVGDTEMLMNGGYTALCTVPEGSGAQVAATYVPMIFNQPPEFAWIKDRATRFPTIVTSRYGKGRVVFFANQTDALCFTNGHEDYTEIYKNALDYVLGGSYSLRSTAPRSVHINALEQQNDPSHLVISAINVTGTSQRPLKELVPVYDFTITLPAGGKTLRASKILWGGGAQVSQQGDEVVIRVDKLEEYLSIELVLA